MIPSSVFIVAVALQTKPSISSKFSANFRSVRKISIHVLSTSGKYMTGFLVESFGECCGSTVLTVACYWPPSHCIPALTFVSTVHVGWIKSQPFTVGVGRRQGCVLSPPLFMICKKWIDSNSRVDEGVTVGSCRINCLLFAHDLVLLTSLYFIGFQLRMTKLEWKLA